MHFVRALRPMVNTFRAANDGPRRLASLLVCLVGGSLVAGCAEQQPQLTSITPQPPGSAAAAGMSATTTTQSAGTPVTVLPGDTDRGKVPGPGPNPRLNLPLPQRLVLSNGTQVLVVERHTLPVAAISVVWPVGALEDPGDRPGMACLAADMLDEGAGSYGALELADALARLGSRLSTRADWNGTYVSAMTLSRNFDETLKLVADVVRRPALSAKELERVKGDTLTTLTQRHDVASNMASDVYEETIYGGGHRRRAPAQGTLEAVKLIDNLDLRWWHRERLRPDDATIIVVGDVDMGSLRGKLEAQLSGWTAPAKRKELAPMGEAPPKQRRLIAVDTPGKSQAVLMIGEAGVPRKHPDYFPLLVMNSILGGQFNSRINMNLREKHGYAYGASSDFAFGRDAGPFAVRASVKGENTRASVEEVMKELGAIRSSDVTASELRQSKDLLQRSLARRFETVLQVASELSAIEIFKLPDNYLSTYADRVESVTVADVRRVAQTYLDPARMSLVVVGERRNIDSLSELNLGTVQYRASEVAKGAEATKGPARDLKAGPGTPPVQKKPGKVLTP